VATDSVVVEGLKLVGEQYPRYGYLLLCEMLKRRPGSEQEAQLPTVCVFEDASANQASQKADKT
jgi:hypothetical protein